MTITKLFDRMLHFLQPRVTDIKSTINARGAKIKKIASKIDNVEDEVSVLFSSDVYTLS